MGISKTGGTLPELASGSPSGAGRGGGEVLSGIVNRLDRGVVRLVLLLRWKRNREAVAARIRAFEATEDDSSWQLLFACERIEDPQVKARLFLQSMEEAHHAEVFRALYQQASGRRLRKLNVPRKPIFQAGEAWRMFAYCAVGEAAAARRFRGIADALPAGEFQTALRKILEEEEGHIGLAEDLVGLTGKSAAQVKREIARIKAVRAWEAWLRVGRGVTNLASRVLLSVAYFAMGWWLRAKEKA